MNGGVHSWQEKLLLPGGSAGSRVVWIALSTFAVFAMLSTAVAQLAAAAMILAFVIEFMRRGLHTIRSQSIALPAIVLLAARVLAIFTSTDVSASLPALWKEIPFYAVVLSVACFWDRTREDRLILWLRIVFGSAAVIAVIGSLRYLFGFDHRASSITSGYYTFGMYLTTVLIMTIVFGRERKMFPNRWMWAVGTGLIIIGILLSMNRIHWIVTGMVLLGVGIWKERRLLVVAVVLCASAIMVVPSLTERIQQMQVTRQNMSDRDILWRGALELGGEHPITGWGLRTFHEIFPHLDELGDKKVGSWHNDFLQLYMESGSLGVLSYVWLLGAALVGGFRTWRGREESELVRTFSLGVVLAILAFILSGMTGVFLTDPIAGVLLRVLLGFAAAYTAINEGGSERTQEMSV